ncbi:hypothetical protein Geob_3229 [Geotalea daltonii FRC-32]|uniref:Uncharacterized protein n=1 Tax=Geotalea daltonii (strain DSM 22248 / JCM 15807 / FRC-32) TaxID=316067 RepID=B9M4B7_GEODF|nr:hypothetical protein Geob_3229 [Geotalea daltonii FRC-32]
MSGLHLDTNLILFCQGVDLTLSNSPVKFPLSNSLFRLNSVFRLLCLLLLFFAYKSTISQSPNQSATRPKPHLITDLCNLRSFGFRWVWEKTLVITPLSLLLFVTSLSPNLITITPRQTKATPDSTRSIFILFSISYNGPGDHWLSDRCIFLLESSCS